LNLSNILLCLLLTYPNINEGEVINQGKLDELTQLFINIIGFQWIQFVERNDLIWDYEKHVTNYSEANLLYIIKRLKEIPEPYHDMVERLKLKIREESTTKWPI